MPQRLCQCIVLITAVFVVFNLSRVITYYLSTDRLLHTIDFRLPEVTIPSGNVTAPSAFTLTMPADFNRSATSDIGYVLATHFSDQLAGSAANTLSFQCWASTIPGNIRVVEPFLHYESLLGFNLNPVPENTSGPGNSGGMSGGPHYRPGMKFENTVRVSDVFDITQWYNFAHKHGFPHLVSWEHFLTKAPRKLILVDRICCTVCFNDHFFESDLFIKFAEKFARYYGFEIVRKTCYGAKRYSSNEFLHLIYGSFMPQDCVVIFNHFGGIEKRGSIFRIPINLNRCDRHKYYVDIGMSEMIMQQSTKYVKMFMPQARFKGYISIMLRMEQFALKYKLHGKSSEQQTVIINRCLDTIGRKVRELRDKCEISDVFISTDVAEYGSTYLRSQSKRYYFHDGVLELGLKRLYYHLYGNETTRESMVKRIEDVVVVRSPGYVALLEKTLAANGTCLLLAGGGTFQEHAEKMYRKQFSKRQLKRSCSVEYIREC